MTAKYRSDAEERREMINRTCSKCGRGFVGYSDDCGCQGNIPIPVNTSKAKTTEVSWFKKHLNLTWLFWLLGFCFFVAFVKTFLGYDIVGTAKNASTYFLCWCMLPVNGWVLYQKGRSMWWLLLALFFPIISIILSNKKTTKTQGQTTNTTELTKKKM